METVWITQEAGKIQIGDKVIVKGVEGRLINRNLPNAPYDDLVWLQIQTEEQRVNELPPYEVTMNFAHAVELLETDVETIAYLKENFPRMFNKC